MTDPKIKAGSLALAVACLCGFGLGWAGASYKAIHEARARDQEPFEAMRLRIEAEEMRLLDLSPEQRQRYLAARDQACREMDRVLGRSRVELDGIMNASDARIRPMLSPSQLAVYDRLMRERRQGLPERPVGADD